MVHFEMPYDDRARVARFYAQYPSVVIAVDDIHAAMKHGCQSRWRGAGRTDGDSRHRPVRVVHGHRAQPRQYAAAVATRRAGKKLSRPIGQAPLPLLHCCYRFENVAVSGDAAVGVNCFTLTYFRF